MVTLTSKPKLGSVYAKEKKAQFKHRHFEKNQKNSIIKIKMSKIMANLILSLYDQ